MGWPQYVYLGLVAMTMGMELAKNGEPRTGNYSFFTCLIGVALVVWLQWKGGFYTHGVWQ